MLRESGLLLVAAAVVASSCEKRPPEPSPPPTTTVVVDKPTATPQTASTDASRPTVTSTEAAPNRCMKALPDEPPTVPPPAASCPPDPVFGGVRLPRGKVGFLQAADGISIDVELATTPEQQERGLMFRTRMPENEGMLFAFDRSSVHHFWMHNTCIPLDLMFVAEDGFITGIVESAPTLNDSSRSIPCPVAYVLEVNAGFSRRHGVKPGQMIKLPPRS
ncbi:MAG: DUF192 domain-containing protein [Deltaproteobacteria bacterium]|nr:DUF192 domain-containing protein [Deltaproteobacteria bacterium]